MSDMVSAWRADLVACGRSGTVRQAVIAWFANPGFALACHYRVSHWANGRGRGGRVLALLVERRMIGRFACHISARACIGRGVHLPHPIGIVIGAGSTVGARATIYHGVTLGRRRADVADYPRVGEDVIIYAGAMLLGLVEVASGARVAAGAILLGEARGGRAATR